MSHLFESEGDEFGGGVGPNFRDHLDRVFAIERTVRWAGVYHPDQVRCSGEALDAGDHLLYLFFVVGDTVDLFVCVGEQTGTPTFNFTSRGILYLGYTEAESRLLGVLESSALAVLVICRRVGAVLAIVVSGGAYLQSRLGLRATDLIHMDLVEKYHLV